MKVDCPHLTGNPPETCERCGQPLTGRRTRWCSDSCARWFIENHRWPNARRKARRTARWRCANCGGNEQLEVNHIIPVVGKRNQIGCHHHQTNLEVLCHTCHVAVTNAQRKAGLLKKEQP